MTNDLSSLPYLGVGIGLRKEISDSITWHDNEIDTLEIISDNFLHDHDREFLETFIDKFPIIPHGVDLSIGSVTELNFDYLKKLKKLCGFLGAKYYSEHFALTKLSDKFSEINIGHLSPLWFTKEVLDVVVEKIKIVQDFLELPLVLENITSFFDIPGADFEEPEFISEVCEKTGCGVLLDATNIQINSFNRKKNPISFLERMPLKNVVQIHLAGGTVRQFTDGPHFFDTHSEELNGVNEGVWPLLEWIAKKAEIKALIIERDENFKDDFNDMVLKDLKRARQIIESTRRKNDGTSNV